ncbi:MAG: hypothetical protein WCW44_03555 [archaeon]
MSKFDLIVKDYLDNIFSKLSSKSKSKRRVVLNPENEFFRILSSKKYCYLTRKATEKYSSFIIDSVRKSMKLNEPVTIYYTLGGGYHAPYIFGKAPSYSPGLGELFTVFQMKSFSDNVEEIYAPGVRFVILIDDVCAKMSNNIPSKGVEKYSSTFRSLLHEFGLSELVSLVLESEYFSEKEFDSCGGLTVKQLTKKDYENVRRFFGCCDSEKEAEKVFFKYKNINAKSRELLHSLTTEGIHLLQRANESCMCFRSFPGGDQRIQCGEMALLVEKDKVKKPVLITTTSCQRYNIRKCKFLFGKNKLPIIIATK